MHGDGQVLYGVGERLAREDVGHPVGHGAGVDQALRGLSQGVHAGVGGYLRGELHRVHGVDCRAGDGVAGEGLDARLLVQAHDAPAALAARAGRGGDGDYRLEDLAAHVQRGVAAEVVGGLAPVGEHLARELRGVYSGAAAQGDEGVHAVPAAEVHELVQLAGHRLVLGGHVGVGRISALFDDVDHLADKAQRLQRAVIEQRDVVHVEFAEHIRHGKARVPAEGCVVYVVYGPGHGNALPSTRTTERK